MEVQINIGEKLKGRYSKENEKWLLENNGSFYEAERTGINYYTFKNGFMCHIYEGRQLPNKTNDK